LQDLASVWEEQGRSVLEHLARNDPGKLAMWSLTERAPRISWTGFSKAQSPPTYPWSKPRSSDGPQSQNREGDRVVHPGFDPCTCRRGDRIADAKLGDAVE